MMKAALMRGKCPYLHNSSKALTCDACAEKHGENKEPCREEVADGLSSCCNAPTITDQGACISEGTGVYAMDEVCTKCNLVVDTHFASPYDGSEDDGEDF